MAADMNLTPSNDGNIVRINVPPLNSETRAQFAKQALAVAEDGKVEEYFFSFFFLYLYRTPKPALSLPSRRWPWLKTARCDQIFFELI
jgi:hypothetical protein